VSLPERIAVTASEWDARLASVFADPGGVPVKQFACGDVVPSCGRMSTAPTDDDILTAVAGRARDDHVLSDIPTRLVAQVRAAIRTAIRTV
jgi:predicted small metal-binding protein